MPCVPLPSMHLSCSPPPSARSRVLSQGPPESQIAPWCCSEIPAPHQQLCLSTSLLSCSVLAWLPCVRERESEVPHGAAEPCAVAHEAAQPRARALQREKPPPREATHEQPLRSTTKKTHSQQQRPGTAKNKTIPKILKAFSNLF